MAEMMKFGDFASFRYGRLPIKKKITESGKYPIYSGYRYVGFYDEYNTEANQLIIVARGVGGTGDVKFTKDRCYLTNLSIAANIDSNVVLPEYLYYYFKPRSLRYLDSGSAQSQITISDLERVMIPIPPLSDQKTICSYLKLLDGKIQNNKQINNNLLEQIQLLCRSWLVDYAPFGYEQPETWSVVPLSSIADFVSGYSYKGAELVESDIAMATIKNFDRKGGFKLDGFKEIQPSAKLKPEQHAQLFDTLVAHTDLTQNAEVIGNAEPILSMSGYKDIVFSMDVVKVLPKEGVSKFLLAALLQDGRFKNHTLGYVNGTTVLHLSKKALPEFELPLPSDLEALAPLANAVEAMYRKIADNIDESTHLANLRDTLLPKLMSGELDVSKIDL